MLADTETTVGNLSKAELVKIIQNEIDRWMSDLPGLNLNEINVARNVVIDGNIRLSSTALETIRRELGL